MRLLYISASSTTGGAQQALYNLVLEMISRGHEVGVMLPDKDGTYFKRLEEAGCRMFAEQPYVMSLYPTSRLPWKRKERFAALKRNQGEVREYVGSVLDRFKPQIVHTNVGPLDLAQEECRKRGIPHVWHIREYQRGMTFYPSEDTFRSLLDTDGNRCIAISKGVFEYWRLDRDRDRIIYDGVIPAGDSVAGSGDGGFFLFAGRVEKTKEVLPMLRAFRLYRKAGGRLNLVIAGKDSGLYALKCKAYSFIFMPKGSVCFTGNREGIDDLVLKAAALIAPCRFEGFGFTVVEAMYRKCPVIGFDGCGIKEQFDNGLERTGQEIGLRFRSIRELADRMTGPAPDEEMKERALRTVTELYTVNRHADQVEAFYKDMLGHE